MVLFRKTFLMTGQLGYYISTYGYLALFLFVFIQETGIPGPPNELVLFTIGMLSKQFEFEYLVVFCLIIIADMAGSLLLYLLFYRGGKWLMRFRPSWLPFPKRKIVSLRHRIRSNSYRAICIGKLTPFVRGYVPVAAGMFRVRPVTYTQAILFTAAIWSGGWMTLGWLITR